MYLYIAYIDGRTEVKEVRMFSDLSTHKSDFYYYEQTGDGWGKGTTVPKSDVLCIEVCSRLGTHDWEWKDDYPFHYTKPTKPESVTQMDAFLDSRPYR